MFKKPKIGFAIKFKKAKLPNKKRLVGKYSILEPANSKKHSKDLYANFSKDKKNIPKRIYDIHYKKLGKTTFVLDLFVDGGIPLKSFIQNSDLTPNVSELLENPCLCTKLDFKNIIV
jgi:hypothetical protein